MQTVSIIGSFRKENNYFVVKEIIEALRLNGIEVLSPAGTNITDSIDDFVIFSSDKKGLTPVQIENLTLEKIFASDIVYVCNVDGYIGPTTAMELGRCIERGKIIFFMEEPKDLPLDESLVKVLSVDELIEYIKGIKYGVMNSYIEITRRCNLKCAHCVRGDSQNIDLSKEDVDMFLDKIAAISHIAIGGGEPTLNPDLAVYIIDGIISRGIKVYTLEMTTNGQVYSEKLADALNRFDCYSRSLYTKKVVGGTTVIKFSVDVFHKAKFDVIQAYIKRLNPTVTVVPFKVDENEVLRTGRSTMGIPYTYECPPAIYQVCDDKHIGIMQLDLNAKGYITTNATGSYIDMDKYNFGHVSELNLPRFLSMHGEPKENSQSIDEVIVHKEY